MADDKINIAFSPEDQTHEYIAFPPPPKVLAHHIAAFANTEGGTIVIGAEFSQTEKVVYLIRILDNTLKRVDETVNDIVKTALEHLRPKPSVNTHFGDIDIFRIFVLEVQKSLKPVLFDDGRYYVRRGATTELTGQDLLAALSQAVPPLRTNILKELELVEPHAERSLKARWPDLAEEWHPDTNRFTQVIQETIEEKPNLNLNKLLSESIKSTRDELTVERRERLQQARIAFIVALVFLVLALILVFVGVVLIFTVNIQIGVVSSVSSIVSGIVSGLTLTLNKQTNERMDEYPKEFVALEKSYTAMQNITYITDIKVKDEAFRDLSKKISLGNKADK